MARLDVEQLRVRYGGRCAVDGVSLSVSAGEIVGLIGPNGAGKTTLLSALSGHQPVAGGRIRLEGRDITRAPAHRRARLGIARTFQAADLISALSVRDNLLLGCQARQRSGLLRDGFRLPWSARAERAAAAEVREITARLGLEGLDHRPVTGLPLGQRRLVEIGRALCLEPKVLLLDEAASGMSAHETERLGTLLRSLRAERGLGVILVEHDVDFVLAISDFIYVITQGRPVARGTPAVVARDEAVRTAYIAEGDHELAAVG